MDPPNLEPQDARDLGGELTHRIVSDPGVGPGGDEAGADWLEEIVARLEADPDECWPAFESLSAVDDETRSEVIAALAAYRDRPGIRDLLGLLGSARDPAVRTTGAGALPGHRDSRLNGQPHGADHDGSAGSARSQGGASLPVVPADRGSGHLTGERNPPASRIVRSLVTAVDGEGRGTVVLSARDGEDRRTAAFRTDVRRGILDVVGDVEREQPSAGRLVDEWIDRAVGDYVVDVPELALSLLVGSFLVGRREVPDHIRSWLEATIGPEALAFDRPAALPGPEFEAIPDDEMPARADMILDACPGWIDRSELTLEMAAEIALREGDARPDPVRDAGAYRYLFEHRLIDRLDTFARMLLWMGWVWHASGRGELARSAFALAAQLSDEQYAVPSHPFTVALSTRSLRAAQEMLLSGARPEAGASLRTPPDPK
jgi:hypothetical protein